MKKLTKIVLIVCLVLGVLGIALLGVGLVKGGTEVFNKILNQEIDFSFFKFVGDIEFDEEDEVLNEEFWTNLFEKPEDAEYGSEEWNFGADKEIHTIKVDSEYATVHILTSEEVSEIEVYGQKGSEEDVITSTVEDGVLTVIEDEKDDFLNKDKEKRSYIRITIPADYDLKELYMESNAGLIAYDVETLLQVFQCKIDAGAFYAEEINFQEGELSVDAGAIEIKHSMVENANINCNLGSVRMRDAQLGGHTYLECDTGKIDVELSGDSSSYGFSVDCGLGSVKIGDEELNSGVGYYNDYSSAEYKVDISCDLGAVKITFAEN